MTQERTGEVKKRVLVVDDERAVLDALRRMLQNQGDQWEITYLDHAADAWAKLIEETYDAVLTDINMPNMTGLELLRKIRETEGTKDIPVVMLTGLSDYGLREQALDLGAIDLIEKPADARHIVARLKSMLRIKSRTDDLKAANDRLLRTLLERDAEVVRSRLSLMCRLAKAAEQHDVDTEDHVIRVGCYAREIAGAMGLEASLQETLLLAAPLHDIGKVGIPDAILRKPGKLSAEEWAIMERHTTIGATILREQPAALASLLERHSTAGLFDGSEDPALEMAASIAIAHHERWDGTGYPRKLVGSQIPLAARVVAIADVFDALCSARPYKEAYSEDRALQIVRDGAGSHFDPDVYAAFQRSLPRIRSIRTSVSEDRDREGATGEPSGGEVERNGLDACDPAPTETACRPAAMG
jgi:response regulator RpfG family c-di-GMP phosphodiesterase